MESEPFWLTIEDVREIHDDQIHSFGGLAGVKDEGLVESAVAAPVNLYHYKGVDDVLALGIRLCMAIARDHGYVDGNKRTGAAAMLEFFVLNGYWLGVPDDNETHPLLGTLVVQTLLDELDESQLYDILIAYFRPLVP
ncbi:death-on-curing protein [Sphingomonas kyeonggiensis]|uniref:type II toxin-antitoxin system death-on-curing family toxin n=1 Tax=Sphingomonas kyeonggiensis TaxID=1268553 RepID=UPI0027822194|nr:type II toxin-antitoxin system death-on-curing family toxin [Sphingomonas kyeonggiensis]MDQ0248286.1 death-on-curing protein [Sphingomonas kyeonggiensis]